MVTGNRLTCTICLILLLQDVFTYEGALPPISGARFVFHISVSLICNFCEGILKRRCGLVGPQGGPRLSWTEVTGSRQCDSEAACAVFKDRHPSTVAMTVLVVVEMFNALNALSENNSLLQVRRPCLGHIFKQHAHNLTELLSNPSVAAVL